MIAFYYIFIKKQVKIKTISNWYCPKRSRYATGFDQKSRSWSTTLIVYLCTLVSCFVGVNAGYSREPATI